MIRETVGRAAWRSVVDDAMDVDEEARSSHPSIGRCAGTGVETATGTGVWVWERSWSELDSAGLEAKRPRAVSFQDVRVRRGVDASTGEVRVHAGMRAYAHKRVCRHTQLRDYAIAGRFRRRNIRRVERTDAGNVTGNVTGAGVSSVSGALCRADTGIGIDVGRRIRAGNVCIPGNVEIGHVPAIGNAYPLSGDPRIRILDGE